MACIFEPRLGRDGEILKWDPAQIPSTKPFVNIATSASEPLSTYDNMNFVKTRSLIYSAFHQTARYVNFDIGYSNEAKWLEFLKDKWKDYANFFVGGFLEAIYSINEKGFDTTYAQINAKLVDYDVRFRNQSNSPQSSKSPSVTTNAFSQRRESFKNQVSQQDSSSFATSPTSSIRESINKQTPKRTYNKRREGKENYFK